MYTGTSSSRLIRGAEENRTTQKVRIGSVTVDLGEQAKCAMDMHAYRYIHKCMCTCKNSCTKYTCICIDPWASKGWLSGFRPSPKGISSCYKSAKMPKKKPKIIEPPRNPKHSQILLWRRPFADLHTTSTQCKQVSMHCIHACLHGNSVSIAKFSVLSSLRSRVLLLTTKSWQLRDRGVTNVGVLRL